MSEISYRKIHTEDTGFGVYDFYDSFVVGKWQVEHATAEQVETLRNLFDSFFQGQPYGYVGNRINPHSVDVASIRNVLSKAENLRAVCFVIYSEVGENVAQIEKAIYHSHNLQIFSNLEGAIQWVGSEMKKIRAAESDDPKASYSSGS